MKSLDHSAHPRASGRMPKHVPLSWQQLRVDFSAEGKRKQNKVA